MAGPLSSEEIEDVVSSVRRLVSNELVARRPSRDPGAERLLLTPALRVVSELGPMAPLILDARVDAPADAHKDVPVVAADASAQADSLTADEHADETDAVELIEAEWEDELWATPEVVSLGEAALGADEAEVLLPSAETVAMDLAPEHDPELDAEPDSDEPSEASLPEEALEPWARDPGDGEDEPVAFVPLRRRAETLTARVASGEASDSMVAAGPHASDAALAPSDAMDDLHDDLSESPAAEAPQRMPTEILDADGTPLAVLDEAALQEIVRLMIREELQGDLGERITRNVRKLVRAEINRALVARDLD